MADSLFQKLEYEAFRKGIVPRTKNSMEWFRNKARNLRNVNRESLLKDPALQRARRPMLGDMCMFFYDPKTKDQLPYYDKFPLVVIVDNAPGGFYGLNLHYLPPPLRAKFLDALIQASSGGQDEGSKFRARYRVLKASQKMKLYKPTLKRYLTSHVKGRIAKVDGPEWEIAVFLPVQQFEKANVNKVYADSRRMLR